jgi:hypothetical protein
VTSSSTEVSTKLELAPSTPAAGHDVLEQLPGALAIPRVATQNRYGRRRDRAGLQHGPAFFNERKRCFQLRLCYRKRSVLDGAHALVGVGIRNIQRSRMARLAKELICFNSYSPTKAHTPR